MTMAMMMVAMMMVAMMKMAVRRMIMMVEVVMVLDGEYRKVWFVEETLERVGAGAGAGAGASGCGDLRWREGSSRKTSYSSITRKGVSITCPKDINKANVVYERSPPDNWQISAAAALSFTWHACKSWCLEVVLEGALGRGGREEGGDGVGRYDMRGIRFLERNKINVKGILKRADKTYQIQSPILEAENSFAWKPFTTHVRFKLCFDQIPTFFQLYFPFWFTSLETCFHGFQFIKDVLVVLTIGIQVSFRFLETVC